MAAAPLRPTSLLGAPAGVEIRRLDAADCIPELTRLLHRAYARLAAMGLRYMATHQSDAVTRERVAAGECWVAVAGNRALIGTIVFKEAARTGGSPWLDRERVASLGQFAVAPEVQGAGLGARLLALAERRAVDTGAAEIALDTAERAEHLVALNHRRSYRLVEYVHWDHTNYRSVIMSKPVDGRGAA